MVFTHSPFKKLLSALAYKLLRFEDGKQTNTFFQWNFQPLKSFLLAWLKLVALLCLFLVALLVWALGTMLLFEKKLLEAMAEGAWQVLDVSRQSGFFWVQEVSENLLIRRELPSSWWICSSLAHPLLPRPASHKNSPIWVRPADLWRCQPGSEKPADMSSLFDHKLLNKNCKSDKNFQHVLFRIRTSRTSKERWSWLSDCFSPCLFTCFVMKNDQLLEESSLK